MAACIALFRVLHMAAECGRAAVANSFESFSLMSAEHLAPLREELFFVGAEDIGHFEPTFSHCGTAVTERARSSEPSVSRGLLAERTALSER